MSLSSKWYKKFGSKMASKSFKVPLEKKKRPNHKFCHVFGKKAKNEKKSSRTQVIRKKILRMR